jgi:pimeloyl-ACP methyl ester carboxylesterase
MRMLFNSIWLIPLSLGCGSGNDEKSETGAGEDTSTEPSAATWHEACPRDRAEQRMINVGEVSLNVACRGGGETTVVFLHGFPEFYYSWNAVMNELVDEYRLIAPDQRGFNISDKPEAVDDYLLPLLTQDILTLLPIVSETPVIVVAHDWGGPVGWSVAHSPDAHIAGLLAVNGPHPLRFAELVDTDPEQQAASSYMELFRSEAAEIIMTPEYLAENFFDFLGEDDLLMYMDAWSQPGAITGGLNWYRANTPLDPVVIAASMESMLDEIPVPVSVMWGLDDTAVLPQNAEGLERYAPDLEVETFEGVDHWIEHRIPEDVARGVRELSERISR